MEKFVWEMTQGLFNSKARPRAHKTAKQSFVCLKNNPKCLPASQLLKNKNKDQQAFQEARPDTFITVCLCPLSRELHKITSL